MWSSLEIPEKLAVVEEALSIQKQLVATGHMFSGYGSLYFGGDAAKFGFLQHFPVSSTRTPTYCIGPLAHQHFIGQALTGSGVDCGPCKSLWQIHGCLVAYQSGRNPQDYLTSIACSSMARIGTHQSKDMAADRAFSFPIHPASNTSAVAISDMLKTLCTAIPHILPHSTGHHLPLLWHKDLHFGNLFVSPEGKITCIIDWQNADILPFFLAARIPQFVDVEHDALLLELPENFSEMPEATKVEVWERYRQSMLQQYYLADLRETAPDLATLLEDEQLGPIRKQVELFARIPFRQDVDALFLRETLLRIQRHWSDFLRDGDVAMLCPIKIEGDELFNHQKDGRRYNEFQDLLKARNIPVADEGWVPVDEFSERKDSLKTVIKETIESLESQKERLEFKNRLCSWNLTDWETT